MKVSGFTFIRNAITYDYPILESILSIEPICDEIVVAVGNSDDQTRALIASLNLAKIKIIDTVWDDSLRENGAVLAVETNKAFHAISADSDWCFYIQGDEVLEEGSESLILNAMKHHLNDTKVDGFLFNYRHFYGSYDYVGASNSWYKNEIRIIRNNQKIYSHKDAQGFRKNTNEKLNVISIPAHIHHYGWVKDPRSMQRKQENFNKLWHDDEWVEQNIEKVAEFAYEKHITQLKKFQGQHPSVMKKRIESINWKFTMDISMEKRTSKDRLKDVLKFFGFNPNYKNYIKVGKFSN
jgi:glycosyltransferase involved in cell wall biosynthesis